MKELYRASINKDMVWEMSHFHFHDLYELLFITGGSCSFLIEDEMIQGRRGTILLMPSGLLHMSTSLPGGEYSRYIINFDPADLEGFSSKQTDLLNGFHESRHYIQLTEGEIAELEPMFKECYSHTLEYGNDVHRNLVFLQLLIRMGQLMQEDRVDQHEPETESEKSYMRVKPLITYIIEHPTEQMTLESVAEMFFYNKHYLCRVFKTATGISVGKLITSVRVQNASTYLRRGYSVQESGMLAGFRNNSNFISTFRKVMDTSPGQYRQRFRAGFEADK